MGRIGPNLLPEKKKAQNRLELEHILRIREER